MKTSIGYPLDLSELIPLLYPILLRDPGSWEDETSYFVPNLKLAQVLSLFSAWSRFQKAETNQSELQ